MNEAGIYRNKLHTEGNFTTVSNAWIRKSGLTPGANFLWIYLLSHKVGYELRDSQILNETGFGPKGLRSARKELVENGWLRLERRKNADGSLGTYSYFLQEPRVPMGTVDVGTVEQGTVPEGSDIRRLIPKKTNTKKTKELDTFFDSFWAVYPKKTDKGLARKSFEKALKKVSIETIVSAAEAYRDDPARKPDFTKNPSTWLNAEAWENAPAEKPKPTPSPGHRDWVEVEHKAGEHWACKPGEFGHPNDWKYGS